MTLHFLLDTNIISDLIRNPRGVVGDRVESVGQSSICVSAIVASELRFGVAKHGSKRLGRLVETTLSHFPILAYDDAATAHYAAIRCDLERRGVPIGANDMLIAAHAASLGLTLVTRNTEEFSRVVDLKLENWAIGATKL